jgi:hypothetical protein
MALAVSSFRNSSGGFRAYFSGKNYFLRNLRIVLRR